MDGGLAAFSHCRRCGLESCIYCGCLMLPKRFSWGIWEYPKQTGWWVVQQEVCTWSHLNRLPKRCWCSWQLLNTQLLSHLCVFGVDFYLLILMPMVFLGRRWAHFSSSRKKVHLSWLGCWTVPNSSFPHFLCFLSHSVSRTCHRITKLISP